MRLKFNWPTFEQDLVSGHFTENSTNAPDVNLRRIVSAAEKNLGSSVPQRDYFVSERADGHSKGSGQTEVGQLDQTLGAQQKILGLQVAVENAVCVTVGNAFHSSVVT